MTPDNSDPLAAWFPDSPVADHDPSSASTDDPPDDGGLSPVRPLLRRPVVMIGVTAVALWAVVAISWAIPSASQESSSATTPSSIPSAESDSAPATPQPSNSDRPSVVARSESHEVPESHEVSGAPPSPAPEQRVDSLIEATAIIALHDQVGSRERKRWINAAVAERTVEFPVGTDTDATFVVLLASVLEGDGTTWTHRHRVRYAVPVRCEGDTCTELAVPWPLVVGPTGSEPSGSSGDAKNSQYVAGLQQAGYREVAVRDVEHVAVQIVAVDVNATPPGANETEGLVVWMLDNAVDPPSVVGMQSTPAARSTFGGQQ